MARDFDPDFEKWVQDARDVAILDVAGMLGAKLHRQGSEWVGPCPKCNGDDRFGVNPAQNVFVCRGAGGGDGIAMVEHVREIEFVAACEFILGEPPPRSDRKAEPVPIDHAAARERREDRMVEDRARENEAEQLRSDNQVRAQAIFDSAKPITGTHGERYLKGRAIHAPGTLLADLRFAPALEYRGHVDGSDEQQVIGHFPCMVAAFRDANGTLIGIHRTYLDPKDPVKLKLPPVKLPSGKTATNLAKKMFGSKTGGLIRLGPPGPVMAVAEGIETALAWYQLGVGPDEISLGAAGDLGNLAGGWTGTVAHPTLRQRSIPNQTPDLSKPGMGIPPEVRELILLGDGDSDPANTRAHILTGARMWKERGLIVSVHMASNGMDWNDVLVQQRKRSA